MAHAVDASGFPIDPELRRLENLLGDLAAEWRSAADDAEHADEVVHQCHATLQRLTELGWDARIGELDYEDLLPDQLMPDKYRLRHAPQIVSAAEHGPELIKPHP